MNALEKIKELKAIDSFIPHVYYEPTLKEWCITWFEFSEYEDEERPDIINTDTFDLNILTAFGRETLEEVVDEAYNWYKNYCIMAKELSSAYDSKKP